MGLIRFTLILFLTFFSCFLFAEEDQKIIKIGLIHFSPPLSKDMDFSPTLRYLQKELKPWKVEAKVYSSANLEKAIKDGTIDFFYASSGFFYRMLPFGVRDIATVVTAEKPVPNFGTAGAFITHRDRSDINSIEDMKGKTLVANYESAFHGYRIGMADLALRGYDPNTFFKNKIFVGESADKLLTMLLDKKADVGFIRACWLEEHELQNIAVMDKIKVIGPIAGPVRCLHSTRAYPNNTFASTRIVNHDVAKKVSAALLSMKPSTNGQYWSLATDFKPVDDLYRVLKAGPYEYMNQWSLRRFVETYWPLLAVLVLAVFGLTAHSWRAQQLVDKAKAELLEAEEKKNKLQKQAQELTERMEAQHKLNLVSQLSSVFAHEMNQPLAACQYLIDGLKVLSKRNPKEINPEILSFSLQNFEKELNRASSIVNKVRQYARKQAYRNQQVNISNCLVEIIQTMRVRYSGKVQLNVDFTKEVFIEGDRVEIEILIWNLVKNAIEGSLESSNPTVWISLKSFNDQIILQVTNTGRVFTGSDVENIGKNYLKSSKAEGLGIGLQVIKSILEAMGTSMKMSARKGGGLVQSVLFAKWRENNNDTTDPRN